MDNEIFALGSNEISWPSDMLIGDDAENAKSKFTNKSVFINIETLIRNAIAAFESPVENDFKNTIRARIQADISILIDHIERLSGGKVVIYQVLYSNLIKNSLIKVKEYKTEKQILGQERARIALEATKDLVDLQCIRELVNPDIQLHRDVYLVTHFGFDLLTSNKFPRVTLLESFSGKEYSSKDFNRKLKIPKGSEEYIPLNRLTLLLFGDGTLLDTMNKKLAKQVVDIAKEAGWNPLTTESRCLFTIEQRDKPMADLLRKLTR